MSAPLSSTVAVVNDRGARRWARGHPWIFRSDLLTPPQEGAGAVRVTTRPGKPLGWALWSPSSEIALRYLDGPGTNAIDDAWWRARITEAINRRQPITADATAYRLVHGEADGCPSLICDRYGDYLVVQLLSAGVEASRDVIANVLRDVTGARGILARNDAPVRAREGLPGESVALTGTIPSEIEVSEHGVKYLAAPWTGQKTGAFLDQRENRALIAGVARGRALDCFSYHGSFALHLAKSATDVVALDSSAEALVRAGDNARLNAFANIAFVHADAFEYLRAHERARDRFDTIVVDPPAFAKSRAALAGAVRGYKEINLRAMRLLAPGGFLFTASCSFHLSKGDFLEMLTDAAGDAGRRLALRRVTAQPLDHPEIISIPETGYLKGALLEALD